VIHYYQLTIQYKGTRYLGWQVQAEDAGLTVQGELNKALTIISKAKAQSMGSGRTDAGVHALGQVVKVSIELAIAPENLLKALNGNLPEDIRVIAAQESNFDFMPTVHAISKEYQYRFTCNRQATALQNDLIVNHPFDLDLDLMRQACKILVGEHDFMNYFCQGTDVSSTVRTIFECEIWLFKADGASLDGCGLECGARQNFPSRLRDFAKFQSFGAYGGHCSAAWTLYGAR
jgi:tRNA pseudouridine38-40 synthase